jgi:hypothetical protein
MLLATLPSSLTPETRDFDLFKNTLVKELTVPGERAVIVFVRRVRICFLE